MKEAAQTWTSQPYTKQQLCCLGSPKLYKLCSLKTKIPVDFSLTLVESSFPSKTSTESTTILKQADIKPFGTEA
jgi:hypothetical protein